MNKKDGFRTILGVFVILSVMSGLLFTNVTKPRIDETLANETKQVEEEASHMGDEVVQATPNKTVADNDKVTEKLNKVASDLQIEDMKNLECSDDTTTYTYTIQYTTKNSELANMICKINNSDKYSYIDIIPYYNTYMIVVFCDKE